MHRFLLPGALVALIAFPAVAFAGDKAAKWTLDGDHTQVGFTATHLKVTKVNGTFATPTGTFTVDPKNFTKSSFDVKIDAASVDTGVEKRDGHLKSKDFFNVEKHPQITFKSTKIKKASKDKYQVTGDLQIAGKTKAVTFDCEAGPSFTGVWGEPRFAFSCGTTINRHDFGVSWNKISEGLKLVEDNVDLSLSAQFTVAQKKDS